MKITAKHITQTLIEEKGYTPTDFCTTTINNVLNRLQYTLKKVRKTLPLKRLKETELIFENIAFHQRRKIEGILKISIDVKDKVKVGQLSRKGYHRNILHTNALDKDQQWDVTLVPLGILEIDSAISTIVIGNSKETSDFIVDGIAAWYELRKAEIIHYHTIEIYLDNGPSVGSKRTQFIKRIMEFSAITGLKIHLLYYPPYHSKYNPIERVWAAVENYWNGTLLTSVEKVINTVKNIKWKNIKLIPIFVDKSYEKGIKLAKQEMEKLELFLVRKTGIPKWDVFIEPSFEMGMLFLE